MQLVTRGVFSENELLGVMGHAATDAWGGSGAHVPRVAAFMAQVTPTQHVRKKGISVARELRRQDTQQLMRWSEKPWSKN